jgi:hypothetical protein
MVDDIFRAAKLLFDQHGDEADVQASEHCDELLEQGDLDRGKVWRLILE